MIFSILYGFPLVVIGTAPLPAVRRSISVGKDADTRVTATPVREIPHAAPSTSKKGGQRLKIKSNVKTGNITWGI
jgi:hypothetical protein